MDNKEVAQRILSAVQNQDFADWYRGKLDSYILGESNAPEEAELEQDVIRLFGLK